MSRYLLEARGVTVSRGGVKLVADLSLGLHAGELACVLGPSGSGKSSMLRVLGGQLPTDRGDVLLDGRDVHGLPAATTARSIGSVPQDDIVHRDLRLRAALTYAARLRFPEGTGPGEIAAAVDRVLADVQLAERARVRIRRLSGGQRKRASVALELLDAPPVLLLDEPTSGLDPALESSTMELLGRLADEGRLVVTTTHSTASVHRADLLVVIVRGRLAWAGPPADALTHFHVDAPDRIFHQLARAEPEVWARRYRQSPHARSVAERTPPSRSAP